MNKYRGISLLFAAALLVSFPKSVHSQSLVSVINNRSNISSFADALEQSGLSQKLQDQGPYTVFAPSNTALENKLAGKKLNSSSVRNLLMNHIITGYASERNMKIMSRVQTLGGLTLTIKSDRNRITVNGITLSTLNIRAQNGILHVIDGVLE